MGDSTLESASVVGDIIRSIFSFFDRPAYLLLGLSYQLFFNVASADIMSNDTIMKFYSRVQLILGVYMLFQLAMTIIKGIVNPDEFFAEGKGAAGGLITRIFTALILLTVLMPISIPGARNEYEKQLNNNGLLFGTLYSLQHRILSNNTLGRLILGNDDSSTNYVSGDDENENLEASARIFTSSVLKGFYRINLLPKEDRPKHEDGKDDAVFNENRVCQDMDNDVLKAYTRLDAEPNEIISMVNLTCDSNDGIFSGLIESLKKLAPKLAGETNYVFSYTPFVSTIVAVVFVFILLSFTVDVAVRSVKLAVLRLVAPIPIISYMDPKGGKDGAFKSWTKTLSSTYLDLFIRLSAVYFAIFLIQDIIKNGVVISETDGLLGIFSIILIWIGIFIFAKQAPKFIKDVLGLKEEPGKLFGGLGNLLAAGAVGAGVVGGAVSKGFGTYAANKGKEHNMAKSIVAGITGGVSGGRVAGKTFLSQTKGADAGAIMNQVRANNARNYSQTSDDSTWWGRTKAGVQANFGFQNDLQKMDQKIARYQRAENAWKGIQGALDSDDWKHSDRHDSAGWTARGGYFNSGGNITSADGEVLIAGNSGYSTKELNDLYKRMEASGKYTQADLETIDKARKSAQASRFEYVRTHKSQLGDPVEQQIYQNAEAIAQTAAKYDTDPDGVWSNWAGKTLDSPGLKLGPDFKGSSFSAGRQASAIKGSAEYANVKANAERAKDKK